MSAAGFAAFVTDVSIRNSVPIELRPVLKIAGSTTEVTVEAGGTDLLKNVDSAHIDVDRTAKQSALHAITGKRHPEHGANYRHAGGEFGDKTSLIAQITTRSGLGVSHSFGSIDASYGTFGTVIGGVSYGNSGPKYGNFIAIDGTRSGRF